MSGTLLHSERMEGVSPWLVTLVTQAVEALGGKWSVGRGVTTDAQQGEEYAKGRTVMSPAQCHCHRPPGEACEKHPLGATVTEARYAHETAHGRRNIGGCAVDLVALNEDGSCDWTEGRYRALGFYVKQRGARWGGDFQVKDKTTGVLRPFFDAGHVEYPNWRGIPLAPSGDS